MPCGLVSMSNALLNRDANMNSATIVLSKLTMAVDIQPASQHEG